MTRRKVWSYRVDKSDPEMHAPSDAGMPEPDTDVVTFKVEVRPDEAELLVEEVFDTLDEARRDHPDVRAVAVNIHRYELMDAWARSEHGIGIEDMWDFDVHALSTNMPIMEPLYDNHAKMAEKHV